MREEASPKPACPLCATDEPARLFESRDRVHNLPGAFTVDVFGEREFEASEKERLFVFKVRQGDEDGGTR
jgi:hypothetical protein